MFIASTLLSYPAPLGAECKVNTQKHIALRWSAESYRYASYKHCAPSEHFVLHVNRNHFSCKADSIVRSFPPSICIS